MRGQCENTLAIPVIKENKFGVQYLEKKYYYFSKDDTEKYLEIFQELKNEGYILKGNFNDNNWKVTNKKEDFKVIPIDFPFEVHSEINLSLKAFWLICVKNKIMDAINTFVGMTHLCKMIYVSNNFNKESIEEFKDWLCDISRNEEGKMIQSWRQTKTMAIKYLNFINTLTTNSYIKEIDCILKVNIKNNSRDIPPFEDLLIFDEIIDDFFSSTNKDMAYLQETYRPIQLYWKLTTIIPTRIGEFIRLKTDCINYSKEKKGDYINIPRIKNIEKIEEDKVMGVEYTIQTLPIHKSIVKLFDDFKVLNDQDEKFLFNYKFYLEHTSGKDKKPTSISPYEKIIMNSNNFRKLLRRFQIHVVSGIYNHDICFKERYRLPKDFENKLVAVQPGDTRHIAVSNLVELGVNPLSIAWFCNHDSLKSQDNYCKNIICEAEIKAKLLGRKLMGMYNTANETINIQTNGLDIFEANMELNKGGFKVDYGVCKAPHGMFDCEEIDCLFCNNFIPTVSKENKVMIKSIADEHRKNIMSELEKIQTTIASLMDSLSVTVVKHENDSFTGGFQEESLLQTAYNQSVGLKNKLAKVEAINYLTEQI